MLCLDGTAGRIRFCCVSVLEARYWYSVFVAKLSRGLVEAGVVERLVSSAVRYLENLCFEDGGFGGQKIMCVTMEGTGERAPQTYVYRVSRYKWSCCRRVS